MIHKIVKIEHEGEVEDSVALSWFDMQKPNLSAVSDKEVSFIMKVKFTHLHENDILVSEDNYRIQVKKSEDDLFVFKFNNHIDFARAAYEIGNRHQPICIEDYKITVLNDISLVDIITQLQKRPEVEVTQVLAYFRPNGKAHHVH